MSAEPLDANPLVADETVGGGRARDPVDLAMERYAEGDTDAFEVVYDALAPRLFAFFLRRIGDPARAEDLVQQTLLQIHDARGTYVVGARVVPWAFAIARNLVVDAHRRDEHRARFEARDGAEDCPSDEAWPDDVLAAKEAASRLERALAALPESHRLAFELLKYDGLSLVEAADVLGISVGALKVRAHRVYKALRTTLDE